MAKILAVDYGTKRVGLAATDSAQIIASPLTTIHALDALEYVVKFCKNEGVETVVVGEPKTLQNDSAQIEQHIKGFIRNLQKRLPEVKIERVDERFTSQLAFQSMIDSGLKKKQRSEKGTIDQVSATIILQSYLDRKK